MMSNCIHFNFRYIPEQEFYFPLKFNDDYGPYRCLFQAHRRDGPLVAIINKLEREVLILKKESSILDDRLHTAQEQVSSVSIYKLYAQAGEVEQL